ncbi:MAG: replication factor C large subunit [Candidatus Heimdallarchaeaceae archaeon]
MVIQSKTESIPWVEKYRPKRIEEFVGNKEAVLTLEKWFTTWNRQTKKAALLSGPAGVGKTSVVLYLINKYKYEYVEVNASDKRNKKAVERLVGMSSTEGTVLQGSKVRKVILVDEADGLFGNEDRGGGSALSKAIEKTRIPIICTVNDPDAKSIKKAKRKMKVIEFKHLTDEEILQLLKRIAEEENLVISGEVLLRITKNSGGDARSAINDLEGVSFGVRMDDIVFSPRNQRQTLDNTLNSIFKARDFQSARAAVSDVDVDYRELLMYVFEHAYKQASNKTELSSIYDLIAEADFYLSQCYRTQNWMFLKYFFSFISSVGLVKDSPYKYSKYGFPSYWSLIGRLRGKSAQMQKIAKKSIKKLHCSKSLFEKEVFPYLKIIFNSDPKMAAGIAVWLQFDEDDINFLTSNSKQLTNSILEHSQIAYVQMAEIWMKKTKENFSNIQPLDFSKNKKTKEIEQTNERKKKGIEISTKPREKGEKKEEIEQTSKIDLEEEKRKKKQKKLAQSSLDYFLGEEN